MQVGFSAALCCLVKVTDTMLSEEAFKGKLSDDIVHVCVLYCQISLRGGFYMQAVQWQWKLELFECLDV